MKSISATNLAIMESMEHLIVKACTSFIDLKVGVPLDHYTSLRFVLLLTFKTC